MKDVKPTGVYVIEKAARGELTPDDINNIVGGITLGEVNVPLIYSTEAITLESYVNLWINKNNGSAVPQEDNSVSMSINIKCLGIEGIFSQGITNYLNNGRVNGGDSVTFEVPAVVKSEYTGYKNVTEKVVVKEIVKVPVELASLTGEVQFKEEEHDVVKEVTKRVPMIKYKYTLASYEELLPRIEECKQKILDELKQYVQHTLKKLSELKPLSDFTRPLVEPAEIKYISKWDEESNSKIQQIPDESLKALGFDIELMSNASAPFTLISSHVYTINGVKFMYPNSVGKRIDLHGNEYAVCQLTGKILVGGTTESRKLYSPNGVNIHSAIAAKLDGHFTNVKYRHGGKSNAILVLHRDMRVWNNMSINRGDMENYFGDWQDKKRIEVFLSSGREVPIIAISLTDKRSDAAVNFTKFLEFLDIDKIDIPLQFGRIAYLTKTGVEVTAGTRLPSLEKVLPIPQTKGDARLRDLHFPMKPDQALGFFRDDNPKPSCEAKPGYRYYGMEIELENPTGDVTADIASGILAPEIIKYGFVYGTDGSLANGLEFRSCPQGFGTMTNNLNNFFSVLKAPYDLSYNVYNVDTSLNKKTGWKVVGGTWKFVDETGSSPIKKSRTTTPDSWKALPSCGLHIHVSRDSLTELQIAKMMAFVYSPKNNKFMTSIAGRTSDRYAEMTSHPPFTIDKDGKIHLNRKDTIGITTTEKQFTDPETGEVLKTFKVPRINKKNDGGGVRDKYTAMSTRYPHTIEFRIFKGVDNARDAITKLQFVDSLIEFTSSSSRNPVSLSDCMSKDKYLSWLLDDPSNRKKYSMLLEFIMSFEADVNPTKSLGESVSRLAIKETINRRIDQRKELMKVFSN